ncbi:hypothetical protein D8B22_19195 [Verminephrobacter aporrectodeae subsp. tuberculatae]|uniref:Ig-like domain-containing protein n=1 Tax=Verminephrobacter aporrectodeae TaxID=1110389 RepID=UPI002242D129|nr:Ig-like domain-containing protein [Verminephrobacter aporrectodeae]MCW8167001.1 hypothetical protein [Verminephrobacter aporrectodeae subsp. tuberculatae]MCW8171176.1 hypothetical protein [Verminephrobacter aporrectodeae subsp. tuberculatae]
MRVDVSTRLADSSLRADETTNTGRPTLAAINPITIGDDKLGMGESTTVTIRFAEAIATDSFSIDDLSVGGYAKLSNLRSTDDGTTWTVTLTAPGEDDFRRTNFDSSRYNSTGNQISVNLAGVTNPAGNAGVGQAVSTITYDIDVWAPGVTMTLGDSTLIADKTTTVTFSFVEPVTGFKESNIDLSKAHGTLGPLTALADGRTWTATFTPTANINAAVNEIRVNLSGVTDLAGNKSTATSFSSNYTIDTRPGTTDQTSDLSARVKLTDDRLTTGEKATVIIAFNKSVTGFTRDDIDQTQANGTLSDPILSADGRTWTATFTPTDNVIDESNTIRVNLAGVTYVTGTTSTAGTGSATSDNFIVNTAPPAATITLADTALTAGETTTVTFTFNQVVLGFTIDDIVLDPNTSALGPFTTVNNKTWTATLTPKGDVSDASNTIRVNLAGVANMAGRSSTGSATSDNYTVNTVRPTATIMLADTALAAGETTTVTIAFSEAVNGFTRDDIVFDATTGTLGAPTTSDNGKTWTATFTPAANANDASNTISVNLAGVTNAIGNAGTGTASSDNFIVDSTPPQLITTDAARPRVNGDQLVLSYTDMGPLDADPARKPATEAFAVLVHNVANAVTHVAVDARAKTVTLTLTTALTYHDQSVSVAYKDPTTDNDTKAIQDAAGNDAASFGATEVLNDTPARTRAPSSEEPNADRDGVPDAQENQAIGPAGAAPGDGNADDIQDSAQAAVTSFGATTSSRSGTSVTLVADSQDGKVHSDSNTRITSLEQEAASARTPQALETPIALTSFQAALQTAAGSSETFSLYVDPEIGANGYWLQDSTGTWVNLASSPYGGKTALEGGRLRLDFSITDGGPFDADGQADGSITAPGAAAKMPLSIVGQASDVAHDGFWF